MTNKLYKLPWNYTDQWEVGQMLLYPYDGYTDVTPQATDAAAQAAGAALENRYTPPDFSITARGGSSLSVEFDKPDDLVGPPGTVAISTIKDSDGTTVAEAGSVAAGKTPLVVRVSLTNSGLVAGDTVRIYSGTGTGSPSGSAHTLNGTDITNGYCDVSTAALTAGAKSFTARGTNQTPTICPLASNTRTLTVTA